MKDDLWLLGKHVLQFDEDDMNERYYYSGGSIRDFTAHLPDVTRTTIDAAIRMASVSKASLLLQGINWVYFDRLCHTYAIDKAVADHYTTTYEWRQVIASKDAVESLSKKASLDA